MQGARRFRGRRRTVGAGLPANRSGGRKGCGHRGFATKVAPTPPTNTRSKCNAAESRARDRSISEARSHQPRGLDQGVIDGDEPNPPADSDGDGLINLLDPDSDNDGILDGTEMGIVTPHADTAVLLGFFALWRSSKTFERFDRSANVLLCLAGRMFTSRSAV